MVGDAHLLKWRGLGKELFGDTQRAKRPDSPRKDAEPRPNLPELRSLL